MPPVETNFEIKQSLVSCLAHGAELYATPLRLTPTALVFELHDPTVVLCASDALLDLKLYSGDTIWYQGRGVVRDFIQTGLRPVCEVKLDHAGGRTLFRASGNPQEALVQAFEGDFLDWQRHYHISPELKVVVADVETLLVAVREWLERAQFSLYNAGKNFPGDAERMILEAVGQRIIRTFNAQHEKFEELVYAAPAERRPLYQDYVGRSWQKLFLGSPFGHRTYHKPLGYAGDYEMMNMIHRNQPEGSSLYDQLVHFLLVSQWPALSVRNRIAHLQEHLFQELARTARLGRRCRVLNLGCGPAREVQNLLQQSSLSDHGDFTFMDFNEETLSFAQQRFEEVRRQFARQARVETRKVSVYQLLKRGLQAEQPVLPDRYDVIYCAGLFDYLSDETCRSLVSLLYRALSPGGLIMVANMKDEKPFRNFIESVLDWHLIYRDARKLATFAPAAAREHATVVAEPTAVNLFLHVRKPN